MRPYGRPEGSLALGYRIVMVDGKAKREHILVAENALGKPLPAGAVIHHVNGVKDDNRPENLVICQDDSYHQHLHRRERELNGVRPCRTCKKKDYISNMREYVDKKGYTSYAHRRFNGECVDLSFSLGGLNSVYGQRNRTDTP